jgi:hypothetical protein
MLRDSNRSPIDLEAGKHIQRSSCNKLLLGRGRPHKAVQEGLTSRSFEIRRTASDGIKFIVWKQITFLLPRFIDFLFQVILNFLIRIVHLHLLSLDCIRLPQKHAHATQAALLFPIVFIEPLLCHIASPVFLALGTRAARKSRWTQDTKVRADSQYDDG